MFKSIEELLVELIQLRLSESKNGLIIKVGEIIDLNKLLDYWMKIENRKLHVSIIGKTIEIKHESHFDFCFEIEKTVEWRSIPEYAGLIVVFLFRESDKLHSLAEFDSISTRDLSRHLLNKLEKMSVNIPIREYWRALNENISSFSFKSVYEYVNSLDFTESKLQESIISNMWILNLLKDESILDSSTSTLSRIIKNQEMRMQISSLSSESQNRLSRTIHNFKMEKEYDQLLETYKILKEYSRFGNVSQLKNLEYDIVELLLSASKPQRKKGKKTKDLPEDDRKVIKGKELNRIINESLLSDDEEDLKPLTDMLDTMRKFSVESDQGDDDSRELNHYDGKFNGNTVIIERTDKDLLKLINRTCTENIWGGVMYSKGKILKEIIVEDDIKFFPFSPQKAIKPLDFGDSDLFGFIRKLDYHLEKNLENGDKFSPLIDDLLRLRSILVDNIELIMFNPNLLFGVDKNLFKDLEEYISTWDRLLQLFNANESIIREKSQQSAHYIGRSLLSLDSLYIKTSSDEWKVIILPLHPLYLWRYYEIFRLIAKKGTLTQFDKQIFAEKLSEIPNLINFVVVDKTITGEQDLPLPHSGNIDMLPTFENKTNRYLGNDGVDYIKDIISRWISYAPYTINEIRIALIDSPDLISTIKSIKEHLLENNCNKIILNSFYTHGQNATGELIKIEYESKDSDITELIKKNRLEIRVFSKELNEITEYLIKKPVHISFFFDQSTYQIQYGKQYRFLHISPLVVSYDYEYDEITRQGSIFPSSDSNDTLIGRYFTLMKYSEYVSSNSYPRPTFNKSVDLQSVNSIIEKKASLWLVVADRTIENYEPSFAVPIGEKHLGRRNICIWTHEDSRIVSQYDQILRNYAIIPQDEYLKKILKDFGHIASEGLISIPKYGKETSSESRRKGLLGTIFAASWYSKKYFSEFGKPLIVSLDSEDARVWLSNEESSERADLLGFRYDPNQNTMMIDVLEVKTRDGSPDEKHATEQVKRMMALLREIFDDNNPNKDIFTLSRREILKFQVITECFRSSHDNEWKNKWSRLLKSAFGDEKIPFNINILGRIIHINLSTHKGSEEVLLEEEKDVSLVRLGTKDIQKWIFDNHAIVDGNTDGFIEFEHDKDEQTPESSNDEHSVIGLVSPGEPVETGGYEQQKGESLKSKVTTNNDTETETIKLNHEVNILSKAFLKACDGFRIRVNSCDPSRAIIGSSVIRYYVELQRGQSLDALINKLDDIGREMSRTGLMVHTILNSNEINLDVPLINRNKVLFSDAYNLIPEIKSPEQMPITVGLTPEGKHIIKDLSQFPHLLIGGSTGSGKTVLLFTILLSLLKTHPKSEDLKLILMSSGIEDFIRFMNLPHLVNGEIISDSKKGIKIIEDVVVKEFERRKDLLISQKVPNITDYNEKVEDKIPPLVVIIDEFADLVDQLSNKKEKERFYEVIRQIAQIGRKRGVHLILCTQRPSADLVPTNIRSLLNTQIALRVNDSSSSRMIMGEMGAENLLKHGDLIFKNGQENVKMRAQGYYVSMDEIDEYIESISVHK